MINDLIDIRESYQRFSNMTQFFWTWFTGKALPNQKPILKIHGSIHLLICVCLLISSLLLNIFVINKSLNWYFILPIGLLITVGSLRKLEAVICHYCAHNKVFKSKRLNIITAEFVSTVILSKDYHAYFRDHCTLHHKHKIFCTQEDPDTKLLLQFGFTPGLSVNALWKNFFKTIFSPKFHLIVLLERLKINFVYPKPFYRTLMSIIYLLSVGLLLVTTHLSLLTFVIVVLIPLIPLFQACALLQYLSEHAWLSTKTNSPFSLHHGSWGRFCGDKLPDQTLSMLKKVKLWSIWLLRFMFYHLPVRIAVLPGDLTHHDVHHRYPGSVDWMTAAYVRQRDIEREDNHHLQYDEVWGLFNAINKVFQRLSSSSPALRKNTSLSGRGPSANQN